MPTSAPSGAAHTPEKEVYGSSQRREQWRYTKRPTTASGPPHKQRRMEAKQRRIVGLQDAGQGGDPATEIDNRPLCGLRISPSADSGK